MPTPFDPLSWLASKGVTAKLLPDGSVQLLFESSTKRPERERIKRVIFGGYLSLLRIQLKCARRNEAEERIPIAR